MRVLTLLIYFLTLSISVAAQTESANCPSVKIDAPAFAVKFNETATFTIWISDAEKSDYKYLWSVDGGEIVEGQGTPTMTVKVGEGAFVRATVEIKGLPDGCKNTFSETGGSYSNYDWFPINRYGKISFKDESIRLDNLAIELAIASDQTAFLLIEIKEDEDFSKVKKRLKMIVKHLMKRGVKKERVTFGIQKSDENETEIYRVPKGANLPYCENCEIIKAKDLGVK